MERAASKSAIQTTTNEKEIISTAPVNLSFQSCNPWNMYEKEWKLGWSRMRKERSYAPDPKTRSISHEKKGEVG